MEAELTPLCELALKHGTDKYHKHHYTETYYSLLKDLRVKRLFEVGVALGNSLTMWEEFFSDARIFGFDRQPFSMRHQGRICTFFGDQGNPVELKAAARAACGLEMLDVIIDDGAHKPKFQIHTALIMMQFLAPDGIYIIEDVYVDPKLIIKELPKTLKYEHVRTGPLVDDVLITIRK